MRLGKEKIEITAGNEILAHKIALRPTKTQAEYFAKAVGTARFVYNWGINEWACQYNLVKEDVDVPQPHWIELNSRLNYIKEEDYPWMKDVTKHAAEHALVNLGKAFDNYLSGKSKYPNFHRKYRNDSFYLHHNDIKLNGKHIKIPKLGWVKMTEPLRFDGKINSATVSRTADKWFVSIAVEMRKKDILPRAVNEIGIDLGISALMTLSDGTKIDGVKPDKKLEASIRHSQRGLSRKQTAAKRQIGLAKSDPLPKGVHLPTSKNLEKNRLKLGKLHLHKANIRKDSLHKLTTNLTKNYTFIAIEDLNTAGMVKNHNLAKAIMNQGWGELKR